MAGKHYTTTDLSKLLPLGLLNRVTTEKPDAVYVTCSTDAGPVSVTFRQLQNAIDGTAYWLENELGKGDKTEGIAYFGTGGGDIRYAILLFAMVKTGYYLVLNSPRNSVDAHLNLFDCQRCKTMILPESRPPYVGPILNARPMQVLQLPALETLLYSQGPVYEFQESFEESRRDPLMALHTSGSTGFPKSVLWTLGSLAKAMNGYQTAAHDGSTPPGQVSQNDLALSFLPMFHVAGQIINVFCSIYYGHKIILPPPGPLLGADAMVALLKSTGATAGWLPPSTLDEIGKRSDLLDGLSHLNYVFAGGGVITQAAGDAINNKTRVINILGSSEFGPFPAVQVDKEDWNYIHFNPCAGVEFRHVSGDEHELVVVRNERLQAYQPCFDIFPDRQELSTHDLWAPHTSKPDLWIYRGRSDDVIGFLNGESTNPLLMERLIATRPEVRDALVFGQGRLEAGLLVELTQGSKLSIEERADSIENLWPIIQEANGQCPAYAKISKSMILFTTPEKPMERAGKGTVQRKSTLAKYASEIDALYADSNVMRNQETIFEINFDDLENSIREIIESATGIENLGGTEDFFSRGTDSFQVIQIARLLKLALGHVRVNAEAVAPSTIYLNPTVSELASTISLLSEQMGVSREAAEREQEVKMNKLIETYSTYTHSGTEQEPTKRRRGSGTIVMPNKSSNIVKLHAKHDDGRRPIRSAVLLTGSTGTLGTYLLENLASSGDVSKIYCLNRTTDAKQRQIQSSQLRGLSPNWETENVVFLTGDLAEPDLGLGSTVYKEIMENVDVIIHNAWQVNFNLTLDSYEQVHIRGVKNLIDLSSRSEHLVKIFFISSISSVLNWSARNKGPVPEEVVTDLKVPQPHGYGQSKHVAERLLAAANTNQNVPISICRVGQIAGPVRSSKGIWATKEWFPSLIISSRHLGVLPDSLGKADDIDWIPIDLLSPILVNLALLAPSDPKSNPVYHTVNPNITSWSALLPTVKSQIQPEVQTVSLATWVKTLRASASPSMSKEDVNDNPALKLMEFFEGLVDAQGEFTVLETTRTEQACSSLREIGPVKGSWVSAWMDRWDVK